MNKEDHDSLCPIQAPNGLMPCWCLGIKNRELRAKADALREAADRFEKAMPTIKDLPLVASWLRKMADESAKG